MTANSANSCPRCGTPASGRFCASCGAPLGEHPCASCGTNLPAGAKFCQSCGTPAGASSARGAMGAGHGLAGPAAVMNQRLPWIATGVLAIVAIAAVVYATSRHAAANAPAAANAANAAAGGVVAPDISSMTPKEQFTRLIDRVTAAAEKGDTATVARFWPMTVGAYQNLPPADRDADAQFHMGWVHLFAAQFPQASALADSILKAAPDHLFGYYLRASVAHAQGDSVAARAATKAFQAHYAAEMAKKDRPEYAQHREMLEKFRDAAKTP